MKKKVFLVICSLLAESLLLFSSAVCVQQTKGDVINPKDPSIEGDKNVVVEWNSTDKKAHVSCLDGGKYRCPIYPITREA